MRSKREDLSKSQSTKHIEHVEASMLRRTVAVQKDEWTSRIPTWKEEYISPLEQIDKHILLALHAEITELIVQHHRILTVQDATQDLQKLRSEGKQVTMVDALAHGTKMKHIEDTS